jgi:hypothetical protein
MALITKKKPAYPVSQSLHEYLQGYGRNYAMPIHYADLRRFDNSTAVYDRAGRDTLWESVFYPQSELPDIHESLKNLYADLKADGDMTVVKHLFIDRVDICTYGNTQPFRVRIVNRVNDNFDYFYVKTADANRIYGLELEHILSPNRISYLTHQQTLIEEHIAGIPGDMFMANHLADPNLNPIRLAKEFVKFNERCGVQLLGDMHSSNFVVVTVPDFEDVHYRIRAIDFDQQSYEGKRAVYLPQFFRQNNPLIQLGMHYMTSESVRQYQIEERSMMATRLRTERQRLADLLAVMQTDTISTPENTAQLRHELARHHSNDRFRQCRSMGDIVRLSLELMLVH